MKIHPRLREQKKTTNTQLRGVTHCIRLIVAEYVGGLTFTPEVLGSSPTRTHFFSGFFSLAIACVLYHIAFISSPPLPPFHPSLTYLISCNTLPKRRGNFRRTGDIFGAIER